VTAVYRRPAAVNYRLFVLKYSGRTQSTHIRDLLLDKADMYFAVFARNLLSCFAGKSLKLLLPNITF